MPAQKDTYIKLMTNKQARIVVVGGGFGGLFTALELADAGEVTLVSAESHFTFRPMLYEYLSGEVEAWHIAPHYRELLDDKIRFVHGEATGVDFAARTVAVAGWAEPLPYDALVLAVGGVTNYAGVEGAQEHALPFRGIADADALRNLMIDTLDRIPPDASADEARRAATFAVVGGGASGCELSTKMGDLLRDAFRRRGLRGEPRVVVVEMAEHVVPGMGEELREYVEDALKESGVEVYTQTRVRRVTPEGFTFEQGGAQTEIQAAGVVWVGGVRVSPLVERLEIPKNKRGLVSVEQTLQVQGHAEVFSLGDDAHFPDASPQLAGTAQLAFQQAALAAGNVRALLAGGQLKTKHFEEMGEALSLGTERAAVLAGGKAFGGALARQARFALYTSRLPTWHHRVKVGASWFFEGTAPLPLGLRRPGG
ncbi:MAG: demethylphylloquinone reductase [Pyrinomonadaceae bacterium]|nr:demethylphylloquinone reductase [Pyrinomonadaceae bacterium]